MFYEACFRAYGDGNRAGLQLKNLGNIRVELDGIATVLNHRLETSLRSDLAMKYDDARILLRDQSFLEGRSWCVAARPSARSDAARRALVEPPHQSQNLTHWNVFWGLESPTYQPSANAIPPAEKRP